MNNQQDKQLFQIQNILETLVEASHHFANLIRQKELNQSIFIFSSIVDGASIIIQSLEQIDSTAFSKQSNKIESLLYEIAKLIEDGNLLKISEILQFSFIPEINKLQKNFITTVGDQKKEKKIIIGIFHSLVNPRQFETKDRLAATLHEGEKQNTNLYFFTSKDVDFDKKIITADTFINGEWQTVTTGFPDVIHNIGSQKRTFTERKLRKHVPFTTFYVGNKYSLPRRMAKYRAYSDLLVPFTVCFNEDVINRFMQNNNHVVFKALKGNRGENIYFLNKIENRYILLDQKKKSILTEQAMKEFINKIILAEKGSYIIQKYIHTRTKNNEPYHFRSHVQKNGEGKWQITFIYPRIGSSKSNLSNISTEGRIEDFSEFLVNEFGTDQGKYYEDEILKLSIDVTIHLDKLYGNVLNELGLDFAIDDTGRIWMHEANNGPQTFFHEPKRALNMIAYAKYLATNGIIHQEIIKNVKNQFNSNTSAISLVDNSKQLIGVLSYQADTKLLESITTQLNDGKQVLYYFQPKDIDFNEMLILGHYFENNQWKKAIFEYPNLMIDILHGQTFKNLKAVYEEFEHLPYLNEIPTTLYSRSNIFEYLKSGNNTINYQKVNRIRNVFQYLEWFEQLTLLPDNIEVDNCYYIKKIDNNFLFQHKNEIKFINELQLRNLLTQIIDKQNMIIHDGYRNELKETIFPEIKIQLYKNDSFHWTIISQQINVDPNTEKTISLQDCFPNNAVEIDNIIQKKAFETITLFEKNSKYNLTEIELVFSINKDGEMEILDFRPFISTKQVDVKPYTVCLENQINTFLKQPK